MGNLNEPSRSVVQLCWFDETDHSDARNKGLTLLSQQHHFKVLEGESQILWNGDGPVVTLSLKAMIIVRE